MSKPKNTRVRRFWLVKIPVEVVPLDPILGVLEEQGSHEIHVEVMAYTARAAADRVSRALSGLAENTP